MAQRYLAAVVHRIAAPTVSQLVVVGGEGPALRANPVTSTASFFGGDSVSVLDSLGAQLVKRVAEIVAHGVHERGVVLRGFAVAACVSKLRRRAGKVAARREGGPSKGLEHPNKKVVARRRIKKSKDL